MTLVWLSETSRTALRRPSHSADMGTGATMVAARRSMTTAQTSSSGDATVEVFMESSKVGVDGAKG